MKNTEICIIIKTKEHYMADNKNDINSKPDENQNDINVNQEESDVENGSDSRSEINKNKKDVEIINGRNSSHGKHTKQPASRQHSRRKPEGIKEENSNRIKGRRMKKAGLIIAVFAVILGAVGGYLYYNMRLYEKYSNLLNKDTFYEGIYVDSIALGGLTMDEAYKLVELNYEQNIKEIGVTVTWDEEEFPFTYADIDISNDIKEVLERAYQVGRDGEDKERYEYVLALVIANAEFETTINVDPSRLESRVRNIAVFRAKEVGEPAVEFNPDPDVDSKEWFDYSAPIIGIQTDDEALWQSVLEEFEDKTYGKVAVPKWEIDPTINSIDLHEITKEIVSFKTRQSSDKNRMHNIALACEMISGTVLMPGQEFSMNNTTGERTKEAGFLEANTIVGGNELVPGIAGGVCQVSGTLFNAAVRADLEITERHHHSFELGYLKRGRDATVNYGTADLRFVNNTEYPIYIAMYVIGRDVYADIFGLPLQNCAYIDLWVKTIEFTPMGEPIYVKDSTVPAGSPPKFLSGHDGIRCETYKIYKDEDGKQIASALLHKDYYKVYSPEYHVHPDDYEAAIATPSPTPPPATVTPAPSTPATSEPTESPTTPVESSTIEPSPSTAVG